jgi:hypothetical protein
MKQIVASLIYLSIITIVAVTAMGQKKAKPFHTSGYYNGIELSSKESGDYFGISIYLTQSANDTFALVTEAQGSISNPVLVKTKTSGKDMRTIEFSLPGDNGERKFKGTVTATGLTMDYFDKRRVLKRQCARTFSNVAGGVNGGDVGGTEVYITDSGGSWFALVSIAEGEMGEPILVPAEVTGKNFDKIAFTAHENKLTGNIGKTSMTLTQDGTKSVLRSKCYQ